jgi:hypothetical protein
MDARKTPQEMSNRLCHILCDSDWPEQPDAWPEEEIVKLLKEWLDAQLDAGEEVRQEVIEEAAS